MITITEYTTEETNNYHEQKYKEFLEYYKNTKLTMTQIFKKIHINTGNSTARYIKQRLKDDGYDPYNRFWGKKEVSLDYRNNYNYLLKGENDV